MRHRKSGVKLNRTTSHRQAMFRNMVTSLLKYDRITTTDAKAKELRRWADHIVTLAKRGDLHARRLAMSIVREKEVVHKLFEAAPERFGSINGGYTRIVKIGRRPGDAAPMTVVELISGDGVSPAPKKEVKPEAETKTSQPESEKVDTAAAATEAMETTEEDSQATDKAVTDDTSVTEDSQPTNEMDKTEEK